MTLTINQTKLTAKKFLMLGEDPPGVRLELIHGEIGVSPSPNFAHSYADRMLTYLLQGHILQHDLGALVGDLDTTFGEYDVRRPDIAFIPRSKLPLLQGHAVPFAPDLCVEILSPSSIQMDRQDKFTLYAEHGVQNYWMLDPTLKTFEAYHLESGRYLLAAKGEGDETVSAPPFPDLKIPLSKLWAPVESQ